MSDEVDNIEQRARDNYPGRNQRARLRQAIDDIYFLVRAVRAAERASLRFIDAICEGVLIPRKLPPKMEPAGLLPATNQDPGKDNNDHA